MELTPEEIEMARQWFDHVYDTNPAFLRRTDYQLAVRLYEAVGLRPSNRLLADLQKSK